MPTKSGGTSSNVKPPKRPKNFCFACGKDNPQGMHLKFVHDPERQCFTCKFRLSKRYTGPPGYCHGGIIATILDDAMGKLNKLRQVTAVTAQMKIDYLRPVPLNKPLRVESRELRVRGRRHFHMAEIVSQDRKVLARSRGVFVEIDPRRLAK
ncbi:MAG: PaaI family thioesterase [Terriglobales bacterium]